MSDIRQAVPQAELRREIDQLGRLFGDVIKHHAGEVDFQLVEEVRSLARQLQSVDVGAAAELRQRVEGLDVRQLTIVVRSFTIFLELANLAEDRQRVRVLRARERQVYPDPRAESVRAALADYHRRGLSTKEAALLLDQVHVELVFTAHPTEAKRRSVRRILRRVSHLLAQRDAQDLLPREGKRLDDQLRGELHKLWQTDFVRPSRPTVLQEVERGLAIVPVLWSEAPALLADLRDAVREFYPKASIPDTPLVRFGSWIGGDRDGNPYVTPEVTAETLTLLRNHAITAHRATARKLARSLSLSDRLTARPVELAAATAQAVARWPALADQLETIPPLETYRRWMRVIYWRLRRTLEIPIDAPPDPESGGYRDSVEFADDVRKVATGLQATGDELIVNNEVQPWLDQIKVFGLQCVRLDLRQHSDEYRSAIEEMWQTGGMGEQASSLDEPERQSHLLKTMGAEQLPGLDWEASESTRKTLALFALVRRTARRSGMAPFGAHVLSMTRAASDILAMLWLWRWSERIDGGDPGDRELRLPLAPLFETIDDLEGAAETLRELFSIQEYREYLAAQNDEQMVMVGYSDSTKDGGYLAAQWALQQSQIDMQRVANEFDVRITFFHGRGGSLGRGGGPAARSILSLPAEAFSGALRLTEQGEVLAERYGSPEIAYRHLEQVCWSSLTAASRNPDPPPTEWTGLMDQLAERSLTAYRQFVDATAFGEFYRAVTPIDEIERLPMGSRPSKRKASNRIEDLRAIPWVFSWTQCRALLPAWFGLGSAIEELLDDPSSLELLRTMHRDWPFFRATISNAELALAKANMPVFRLYAELGSSVEGAEQLAAAVMEEYERSARAVCSITNSEKLLDEVSWLQRSIQVRNGYVDPLNVVQTVLLERLGHNEQATGDLEHLMNININGVSAGMRTTG